MDTGQSLAAWPLYQDIRTGNDVFSDVAAYRLGSMGVERGDRTVKLRGQITSANYLAVLGVPAELGRSYAADDPVSDSIVLAHHTWQRHFGADAQVVGQTLQVGGRSLQVLGVMPRTFRGIAPPGVQFDAWMPVDARDRSGALQNRSVSQFEIVGRLKPGVEHGGATAALRALAGRLRIAHPELPESLLAIEAGSIEGVHAFRGMASVMVPLFGFLALLAVISAFVLVIGCSNIAGLLVGRAAMRQREMAVRLSLGSSRARLLRQLLTESLVLALAGGAAGLIVATAILWAVRNGVARLPFPLALDLTLDHRVLAYVIGLSTVASVFFGLLPARGALGLDLVSSLKADSSGSPRRQRLRRLMVMTQVASCAALVMWSVLFLRSLGNVHAVDPGFEPDGVLLSAVELDRGAIDAERGDQIVTEWTQRVGAAAGVQSVAAATVVPLALTGREEFDVSLPTDAAGTRRRVEANRVTPGWFETVSIPLAAGRDFTWQDRRGAPAVVIVNETMSRQFWDGAALGQRLQYGDVSVEVVGVARDSRYRTLGEVTRPLVYLPLRQVYSPFITLHARTGDPRATAASMTRELQGLLPGVDVQVGSMAAAVAVAVLPAQIGATATGTFGALAVLLAALGVYGLVSFSVVQRRREIGIRRAIGASAADILRLILREHAALVGAGLVIGLTAGALGATLLRAFLTGVGTTDPLSLLAAVTLVASAALAATMLPVRRATRVDPMIALRDV